MSLEKGKPNPSEIAQRNIQLAERYSRTIDSAPPFVSHITFVKTIRDEDERNQFLDDFPKESALLQRVLDARDVHEAGFSQFKLIHKDNPRKAITISRAQTEEGMRKYEQEVDFLPPDLTYPTISIHISTRGEESSVATPFGDLPSHVIDARGDEVWFSNTYLLSNTGQGYQVQDVCNFGDPKENDSDSEEEIAKLPHVKFIANDSDSRAIPLGEDHIQLLELAISQIEKGEFVPVESQ